MKEFIPLILGITSLITGIVLFFQRPKQYSLTQTISLSWLLIALFPVFFIFSVFPDSSISGKVFNFSFGGAIGAFFVIWRFGMHQTLKSERIDKLTNENEELKQLITTNTTDRKSKVLEMSEKFLFKIKSSKKKIGIITGPISKVTGVDIWVNSENTNMQMARYYEQSISANIRYLGAIKDRFGKVESDQIAEMLQKEIGDTEYVHPATVISTKSGELEKSHRVKRIFHVAAVQGEVGHGYRPVKNINLCIQNSLEKADEIEENFKSILFPIIGTGTAKGTIEQIAESLFETAINYLLTNSSSRIEKVFFLTYTDIHFEKCYKILVDNQILSE